MNTSRAYGAAGAAPFGTSGDMSDFAQARKILDDNGAPQSDMHMVLGGAAVPNVSGKMSTLQANTGGPQAEALLRMGALGDFQGLLLHDSAQVKEGVISGTGASATTNTAGYAVGATVITLASAGTGAILAGDIITFAGDTNEYVVVSGDADTSNGGSITIAEPGLRVAMSAAAKAITVIAASHRNMFFHRSAIQLATRAPAMPEGGDAADDVMIVTRPCIGPDLRVRDLQAETPSSL
ncbi:hypothetical protein [Pseudomonas gorinensis]